jgi:molecular chaperone DnaK
MFELTGLPPAPRGVPQIEVTFDIDANGIVHVSAKDLATNKEQGMTITGGSGLSKEEIDRMMADAEAHAEDDRKRRDQAEVRNLAEGLQYTTEKFLADNGDKIPAEKKTELESALDEVKKTLEGNDVDAIKAAHEKLSRVSQETGSAMYEANSAAGDAGSAGSTGGEGAGPSASADDDTVVDAEVVDEGPSEQSA